MRGRFSRPDLVDRLVSKKDHTVVMTFQPFSFWNHKINDTAVYDLSTLSLFGVRRSPILFRQEYLGLVQAEVRAENEMVEEFVREQMGISTIIEARTNHASSVQ